MYAQIEKVALAVSWACENFSDYHLRMDFIIASDHKSLISLLGSKNLDMLPPRIFCFRLQLARYNYSITHVPEKLLYTADTVCRLPPDPWATSLSPLEVIVENFMGGIVFTFPATSEGLEKYQTAQKGISRQVGQKKHRWTTP